MIAAAVDNCRICEGEHLTPVLDLGILRVSSFPEGKPDPLHEAPLRLLACDTCATVQLAHTVPPEILFQGEYWYASGINGTMREELRHIVRSARQWVKIADGDWVLDIGANDGTLLSAWREHLWEGKPNRMAVEPAGTFAKVLADTAEAVVTELFPTHALAGSARQFKAITSVAMFDAVPTPVEFAQEVARLLTPDGVWIVQMQDLQQMVEGVAVDNICHEHLIYYTPETLAVVCRRAGLKIVEVTKRTINGGSLRFVIQHETALAAEVLHTAWDDPINWDKFDWQISDRLVRLQDTVALANNLGHVVDLLGASTKGNTLLQLAGLGPAQIRQAWERHPKKLGRTTITGIPIVSEAAGRAIPPNLLICPIWQFRDAVIEREREYLKREGRIYFPLPTGDLFQGEV